MHHSWYRKISWVIMILLRSTAYYVVWSSLEITIHNQYWQEEKKMKGK